MIFLVFLIPWSCMNVVWYYNDLFNCVVYLFSFNVLKVFLLLVLLGWISTRVNQLGNLFHVALPSNGWCRWSRSWTWRSGQSCHQKPRSHTLRRPRSETRARWMPDPSHHLLLTMRVKGLECWGNYSIYTVSYLRCLSSPTTRAKYSGATIFSYLILSWLDVRYFIHFK